MNLLLGGFIYGIFINLQNFGIDKTTSSAIWCLPLILMPKNLPLRWNVPPVSAIFLFIGTALYAYYKVKNGLPEDLVNTPIKFFLFYRKRTSTGGFGFVDRLYFCCRMSTISTSFNSTSTVLLTDYFKKNAVKIKNFGFYGSTVVIA